MMSQTTTPKPQSIILSRVTPAEYYTTKAAEYYTTKAAEYYTTNYDSAILYKEISKY
jgi:hypothetical protein